MSSLLNLSAIRCVVFDFGFTVVPRGYPHRGDIDYHNGLLIEDGPAMPALFRRNGRYAYEYAGDEDFSRWLHSVAG